MNPALLRHRDATVSPGAVALSPPVSCEGWFVEQVGGAVVGGEHAGVAVSGLSHDQVWRDAACAHLGDEPGSEAVPGVVAWVVAEDVGDMALHDE